MRGREKEGLELAIEERERGISIREREGREKVGIHVHCNFRRDMGEREGHAFNEYGER